MSVFVGFHIRVHVSCIFFFMRQVIIVFFPLYCSLTLPANVPSECGTEGNKQDVPKICSTVHSVVTRLPRELLKRVVYIGKQVFHFAYSFQDK